jgi:exonuclease III
LKAKPLVKLKQPVVLLGDYNVVPSDLDAPNPSVG